MNIIELAKEAGFVPVSDTGGVIDWECSHKSLERFAALVRAEELEEAAKVCDRTAKDCSLEAYKTIRDCAAAIRELK